jgi:GR25 family glycosyltransferase involved in LPS biosynthesis
MKAFVITILSMPQSVQVATRCIESAKSFDIAVEMFPAITPENDIYRMIKEHSINIDHFSDRYSRKENAIACFLSHYSLWKYSFEQNASILIFEHDAVVVNPIDLKMKFKGLLSLGKPSYGKYNTPKINGINPLTSKNYIPGAHAYMIRPNAARELISKSKMRAIPPDVFIDRRVFPWIEEFYPWPVEVQDTFTTVQKVEGCIAKHNYGNSFQIL